MLPKELVPMLCNPLAFQFGGAYTVLYIHTHCMTHTDYCGGRVSVPATQLLALQPGRKAYVNTRDQKQRNSSFLVFTTPVSAQCEYIPAVSFRAAPQQASAEWRMSPIEELVAANKTKEFGYNKESHPLLTAIPPLPFALTRDFDIIIQ